QKSTRIGRPGDALAAGRRSVVSVLGTRIPKQPVAHRFVPRVAKQVAREIQDGRTSAALQSAPPFTESLERFLRGVSQYGFTREAIRVASRRGRPDPTR